MAGGQSPGDSSAPEPFLHAPFPHISLAMGQFSKGLPPWSLFLSLPNKVLIKNCSSSPALGWRAPEDRGCQSQKPVVPRDPGNAHLKQSVLCGHGELALG